jgi:predicted RNA binding protein YcfA (HicA-like mRNA interferase family)
MPKRYSASQVMSYLKRAGFTIVSQRGSHIKLQKKTKRMLTVIVPNHKEIATGTFASILRQAEMTKQQFEKLME